MKKLLCTLTTIILALSFFIMPLSICAKENDGFYVLDTPQEIYEEDLRIIPVSFCSTNTVYSYDFPYSDQWFRLSDSQYNHQLAQGSMGLTVAAFRYSLNQLGNQDESIIQYYKAAGFSNIETYNYEKSPSDNSISNGIASKMIDDFTLLAVGVCGANYRDEWCSNLTIGNSTRHEGFDSSAKQVEARIEEYILKYQITGKIKVWITGFSRASAVSNLVGADLTDSGKFDAVYGYHFAVPNNTTENKQYNNLFCIVGANDPVTYVSLKEWGYQRCGTTLYTPSRETDSDFNDKLNRASAVYETLTHETLIASSEINKSIRLILTNILDMIPTQDYYYPDLQSAVITAWHAKSSTSDLIPFLVGVLNELGKADENIQKKTGSLGEYILNLGIELTTKNPDSIFADDLYKSQTLAQNLIREHQPMVYIAWLFSSNNPAEIYCDNTDFTRLYIDGDVIISIYDESGLIETIDHGTINKNTIDQPFALLSSTSNLLYSSYDDNRTEIIIPKDQNYLIQIHGNSSFTFEGFTFTDRYLAGKQIEKRLIAMKDQSDYYILSRGTNNNTFSFQYNDYELIESSNFASPTVLLALEDANVFHLTFSQIKTFAKINIALLAAFVLLITIRFIRVSLFKKKAARIVSFSMNLSISCILMLLYEQANIYLDTIPVVRTVLGVATMFSVLQLCYTAMKPINRNLSRYFLWAIFIVSAGNFAKQYLSIEISTILYCLGCIIITIGILENKQPSFKQLYIWFMSSTALCLLVFCLFGRNIAWLNVYIFIITAMNVAAMKLDHRLRYLIGAFMLPSCLSVWESYTRGHVKIDNFLVLVYSIMLLMVVAVILHKSYRLEKEELKSQSL